MATRRRAATRRQRCRSIRRWRQLDGCGRLGRRVRLDDLNAGRPRETASPGVRVDGDDLPSFVGEEGGDHLAEEAEADDDREGLRSRGVLSAGVDGAGEGFDEGEVRAFAFDGSNLPGGDAHELCQTVVAHACDAGADGPGWFSVGVDEGSDDFVAEHDRKLTGDVAGPDVGVALAECAGFDL